MATFSAAGREVGEDLSGAVVASRRAVDHTPEELRRPLRSALTQLVLAGLPKSRILSMVGDELVDLMKGGK